MSLFRKSQGLNTFWTTLFAVCVCLSSSAELCAQNTPEEGAQVSEESSEVESGGGSAEPDETSHTEEQVPVQVVLQDGTSVSGTTGISCLANWKSGMTLMVMTESAGLRTIPSEMISRVDFTSFFLLGPVTHDGRPVLGAATCRDAERVSAVQHAINYRRTSPRHLQNLEARQRSGEASESYYAPVFAAPADWPLALGLGFGLDAGCGLGCLKIGHAGEYFAFIANLGLSGVAGSVYGYGNSPESAFRPFVSVGIGWSYFLETSVPRVGIGMAWEMGVQLELGRFFVPEYSLQSLDLEGETPTRIPVFTLSRFFSF